MSIITNLFGLPASFAGLDLPNATRRFDGVLHAHGARTIAVPDGMAYIEAGLGARAIATTMLEGERFGRAVLSHVRVAPFFASVVLMVHPSPEVDAPLFLLDLHVIPVGRARAYLDTCGPGVARPEFRANFWEPLRRSLGTSSALRSSPVPAWMAAFSGGCGAVVRARPGSANRLVGLSELYLEAYLRALATAPAAKSVKENERRAREVTASLREHGRSGRMLNRAFGADIAARYTRVLYND